MARFDFVIFISVFREWKKAEENLIIKNHKEEKHIRCKVEHMKQNGNDAFQAQRYKEAIDLYTEAIGKCPIRILCPDGTNCPSFNSGVSKEESLYHWWVKMIFMIYFVEKALLFIQGLISFWLIDLLGFGHKTMLLVS